MRLWSLHPKHLDTKGLVALWREGLLAKKVLQGKTKGYKNHSQLIRFKKHSFSLQAVNNYLFYIFCEASKRGFNFNKTKVDRVFKNIEKIKVTSGQVSFEFKHLKKKLRKRNPVFYRKIIKLKNIETHPLFKVIAGKVEFWEKIN
jgi:hypothetical protein